MKTKTILKNISYWSSIIIIGVIFGFTLQFVKAWTEPTISAPNGNVGAPINTSTNSQIKQGALQVNGFRNIGTTILDGNVGIGTTTPSYKLHVIGDVYANGGWFRTSGSNGWYSETYGGGLYMSDTSWIRTYNSKSIWTDSGLLGSQGGLTVGYGGVGPNTSGGAIIAGNVGIGTTTPTAKLQIGGTAGVDGIKFADGTLQTTAYGGY